MGTRISNKLQPQTIAFGGDNTMSVFPVSILYNDDEPLPKNLDYIFKNDKINEDYDQNLKEKDININEFPLPKNKIQLNSILEYKAIDISNNVNFTAKFKMLTTIKVEEIKSNIKTSIDLICVIDRSWSMKGMKLELLKESFNYILDFLDEKDRISIIVFDNEVERLCPLLCLDNDNKMKVKQLLTKLVAKGGTNIATAMQHGIEVIKQRKFINNVTSIFLLSDGIDLNADIKIKNLLNREKFYLGLGEVVNSNNLSNIINNFTINTFGYGNDHDAKLMSNISQLADGNFYYIDDIKLIDECFLSCLVGLVSVIAQNVILKIIPNVNYCKIEIPFGMESNFDYNQQENSYSTKILQLISGRSFNILTEILIDLTNYKLINTTFLELCNITCSLTGLRDSGYQDMTLTTQCSLMFANPEDKLQEIENIQPEVKIQYYRLKTGQKIREAKFLSDSGDYSKAKKLLEGLLDELKSINLKATEFSNLINEVERALIYIDPNIFKTVGKNYLTQLYYSQINEKHNIIGFSSFGSRQQERFISSYKQKKLLMK